MALTVPTIVIVGTNTEVGKTWIGTRLAAALAQHGLIVGVYKPLESGAASPEGLRPTDAIALREASQTPHPLRVVCPWPLPEPVTPAQELRRLGFRVTKNALLDGAVRASSGCDVLLVESAGGLKSPITESLCSIDLGKIFKASFLLVSRDRLGTINDTSLSTDAVVRSGRPLIGVVLNRTPDDTGTDIESNAQWIRHLHPAVPLFPSNWRAPISNELFHAVLKTIEQGR